MTTETNIQIIRNVREAIQKERMERGLGAAGAPRPAGNAAEVPRDLAVVQAAARIAATGTRVPTLLPKRRGPRP